jgi:hypothetical protein
MYRMRLFLLDGYKCSKPVSNAFSYSQTDVDSTSFFAQAKYSYCAVQVYNLNKISLLSKCINTC